MQLFTLQLGTLDIEANGKLVRREVLHDDETRSRKLRNPKKHFEFACEIPAGRQNLLFTFHPKKEGRRSISAHIETEESQEQHAILVSLRRLLAERFSIEHATIQLETVALHQELEACCGGEVEEVTSQHAAHHR